MITTPLNTDRVAQARQATTRAASSRIQQDYPRLPRAVEHSPTAPQTLGMLTSARSTLGDLDFEAIPVNQAHLDMEPPSLLQELVTARLTAHPEMGSQPFNIKVYVENKSISGSQYQLFYPDSFEGKILLTPIKMNLETNERTREFVGLICSKHRSILPILPSGSCNPLNVLSPTEIQIEKYKHRLLDSVRNQVHNRNQKSSDSDKPLDQDAINDDFARLHCLGAIVIESPLINTKAKEFSPLLRQLITEVLENQIDLGESLGDDHGLNCCSIVQNNPNCTIS